MLHAIQVKAVITFDHMLCVLSMAEECDAVHIQAIAVAPFDQKLGALSMVEECNACCTPFRS